LIDRNDTWSGNPRIRMTNQPQREFVYRMAFVTGRTIWGYETQKALAAVDWFAAREPKLPIGIWGYGEGGAAALFAAALDDRIAAAGISGYLEPREDLWKQPIFRNVFGLLKDFGDAELIAMAAPRAVIVDTTPGPSWNGNPETAARRGAAPGTLIPASPDAVAREAERARALNKAVRVEVSSDGAGPFLRGLGAQPTVSAKLEIPIRDAAARQHRQFDEMVEFTERLLRLSQQVRDGLWSKADGIHDIDQWKAMAPALRSTLWNDVIGRLPSSGLPLNVRTRRSYGGAKWDGYEVAYDVLPGVFGYGVLLMPKDIRAGERRPVVVAQHGLEDRPQYLFGQDMQDRTNVAYTKFHFYQNIGSTMADLGYIVYLPQNPYIGDFRKINRLANPMGWSLFSFVLLQNERLLDWLDSMPEVDPARIGFYGLSYGGKTALRIPTLLDRYALSICSGDFNEWVDKLTNVDEPISYMFTNEYEMSEWNLAGVANHGEMAKLMAPRPFMVERGHRDAVGIDERVAYEYAKVRRFYDELGIGDRTEIEYFNGPHMMHAVGTVAFLRKYLGR
jgi:cephalosporin-C deacetylase-like acetyl esterase